MIGLTIAGTRPAGTRGTQPDDKCAAEHDSGDHTTLGITLMIYFELSVIRWQFLFQETKFANLFRNKI